MSRGVGVGPWLADTFEVAEPVFAVLTQVGSTWLLGLVAVVLYLSGDAIDGWDRRRGAATLGALLLGIALTGLFKTALALPRPPGAGTPAYAVPGLLGDVYAWAATADGFGVPSGHALGATAVYGTIASLVDHRRRFPAALVAAGLVGVASLSRLVLGVHLLVDVVAGTAVGLVVVAVAWRWAASPGRTFGLALAAAAGWALLAGGDPTALGAAGVCVGALYAWHRFGDRLLDSPGTRTPGPIIGALLLAGLALAASDVAGPGVAAASGLVGMAAVVVLPLAKNGIRPVQKVSR